MIFYFLDVGMDMLTKPFALDALGAKVHAMIQRPLLQLSEVSLTCANPLPIGHFTVLGV